MNQFPSVTYYVAASVDGFIAAKDGGVGWLEKFSLPGEDYGYSDFFDSVDAMVMGRRSYEQVVNELSVGHWPYGDKPCWIFSSQKAIEWKFNVNATDLGPRDFLDSVAGQFKSIWLVGGTGLAESFRRERLITHYQISLIPILLGDGIPLFGSGFDESDLVLEHQSSYPNGVAKLKYRVDA